MLRLNENELLLPDAFDIAHDPKNVLLIWWYNLHSGQFESDTSENHIAIAKNKNLAIDKSWIKGRLLRVRGRTYLVAYIRDYLHNPIDADNMNDLTNKVRAACKNVIVDYVADERGFNILEALKQSDREVLERLLVSFGG